MLNLLSKLTLSLYKLGHLVVIHRLHELHVDLLVLLKDIHNLLNTFLYNLPYSLVLIQLRFLLKISYRIAGCPNHLSFVRFLNTGNNLHKCRLAGTVQTDDTDLCTIEE